MDDEAAYEAARARIAAQRGRLRGWRPLPLGDVAVVAVQVLGMAAGAPDTVGLRVVVAARDAGLMAAQGPQAVELALRKRGILSDDDRFEVARHLRFPDASAMASRAAQDGAMPPAEQFAGAAREAAGGADERRADDLLSWPWATIVVDVPARRLPAIAGLATDQVHGR